MNATEREGSGRRARGGCWALALGAASPAHAAFDSTAAATISWFYAAAFGRTPIPNSTLPDYGDLSGLVFWTEAWHPLRA